MDATTIVRGIDAQRELTEIARRSRCLFKNAQIDQREEFNKGLREHQWLFAIGLNSVLDIFRLSRQLLTEWKQAVFRGEEPYTELQDTSLKNLFATWLSVAQAFQERIEFYERYRHSLVNTNGGDLKLFIEEVGRLLQTWEKPTLSMAIGLRTRRLSPAGEAKMLTLLKQRNQL